VKGWFAKGNMLQQRQQQQQQQKQTNKKPSFSRGVCLHMTISISTALLGFPVIL